MRRARLWWQGVARAVLGACSGLACDVDLPPRGQVLVYIDTDAPVDAATSPSDPAPLFDRLLVEFYAPGEATPCPDCRRELVIDADKIRERRFSFGFVPRPHVLGYRVRLVLHRSLAGLGPRARSSIELVGYLPAVDHDGIKEVTAHFFVGDVGRPRGALEAPLVFDAGRPVTSRVGTWPEARVVDCVGVAPPDAVCVPGGAFFMGDPRVTIDEVTLAGASERLVVVPPFFLDRREVTVGDLRASRLARLDSRGRALDPEDDLADPIAGRCVYSADVGPHEALPVSCVTWELARSYCRSKGGDLPSDAELELVASGRGSKLFPWGDHEPTCADAVIGGCADAAFDPGERRLPSPAGSGARDRVDFPAGEVLDLGANLAEWTRDVFQADDGPCWSDPTERAASCVATESGGMRTVKGGDFATRRVPFAQARRGVDPTYQLPEIGFRCAYAASKR